MEPFSFLVETMLEIDFFENSSFSELPRNLSNAKGSFHFSSENSFKSYIIPDCPTNQKFCIMEVIRNFT
jgi:hypothetical protein